MAVVVITGIPGVGKTSVVEVAQQRMRRKYDVLTFGTVMFELAREKGLVEHRDELRSMGYEEQRKIQEAAASRIAKAAEKADIIVDTHCFIKTPRGYLPGLPLWVLERLKPSRIILIEADIDEIIRRRLKDESRRRDEESEEELKLHIELNRAIASAYSMVSGGTLSVIQNHDGRLNDAANHLRKILE